MEAFAMLVILFATYFFIKGAWYFLRVVWLVSELAIRILWNVDKAYIWGLKKTPEYKEFEKKIENLKV